LWVRAALGGPQISQSQSQLDEPSRLEGVYIDIINALFLELNQLIPLLPQLFFPVDGGPSGVGDLVITEMANDGANSFVEVLNPGSLRLELENWAFCKLDACTASTELAGIVMEPGDIRVFQLGGQFDSTLANSVVSLQVGTTADDIGLYDFTGEFVDAQDQFSMRDYLQWGDFLQSFGLEDVAVSAGLWVTGSSIQSSLASSSFQLATDRLTTGGTAGDYIIVPFEQNTLGALTTPDVGANGS